MLLKTTCRIFGSCCLSEERSDKGRNDGFKRSARNPPLKCSRISHARSILQTEHVTAFGSLTQTMARSMNIPTSPSIHRSQMSRAQLNFGPNLHRPSSSTSSLGQSGSPSPASGLAASLSSNRWTSVTPQVGSQYGTHCVEDQKTRHWTFTVSGRVRRACRLTLTTSRLSSRHSNGISAKYLLFVMK